MPHPALVYPVPESSQNSKASKFRALLTSSELEFLMEAHNGLSAKIVEEAGFKGIWASGLSMATALGVRDRNEASWTQVIETLEFMSDATSVPIMLDGDTGYGDFNNFRRLVVKLCQRGIAAVCIEDKVFPKTNSLIDGKQVLADIEEFCGKIRAGKDSQLDDDFSVVARIEALIAGWGMDEALRRAEAYHEAGADAILIHSKKPAPDEILAFAKEWAGRSPLVIVPTTYYATPTERFREAGLSMAIWANHNLRASISAMREISGRIFAKQSLNDVEGEVASLKEVFALAGNSEMVEAERRYLSAKTVETQAVVLAATRGSALAELTEERPKCMLDLRGEPLLRRLVRTLNNAEVRDVTVVCGYKPEAVDLPNIKKVVNQSFETSGEVSSLACALGAVSGPAVISYGDIVFRDYVLDLLLQSDADIVLAVDAKWQDHAEGGRKHAPDLVVCDRPYAEDQFLDERSVMLERFTNDQDDLSAHGEWIGLARVSRAGLEALRDEVDVLRAEGTLEKTNLPDLFTRLASKGMAARIVYITGHWLDINDAFDLARARNVI